MNLETKVETTPAKKKFIKNIIGGSLSTLTASFFWYATIISTSDLTSEPVKMMQDTSTNPPGTFIYGVMALYISALAGMCFYQAKNEYHVMKEIKSP